MMNSLLLFSGVYFKKYKFILMALWIGYLIYVTNFSYGYVFPIINAVVGLSSIFLLSFFKKGWSIASVLIYSVLIDVISFIVFPMWHADVNLIQYVYNGILFNYKSILLPLAVYVGMELNKVWIMYLKEKRKTAKS